MHILDRRNFVKSGLALTGSAIAYAHGARRASAAPTEATVFTADPAGALVDSTVIVGEENALLVDAQMTRPSAEKLADVIAATGRTLETIFITHYHPDHHLGLAIIKDRFPDAKVLAHSTVQPLIEKAAEPMLQHMRGNAPDAFADRVVIPEALQGDSLTLEGERIDIVGPLHGDTAVTTALHIPALDTLVAADIVFADTHLWTAENTKPEQIAEWRASLKTLEATGAGTVIPGHRIGSSRNDASAFAFTRTYLGWWEDALGAAKSAEDLKAAVLERAGDLGLEFALDRAVAAAFG